MTDQINDGVNTNMKIDNLSLAISFRIGVNEITIAELKGIKEGSVLPLDSNINDSVSMLVNGQEKAKGHLCESDGGYAFKVETLVN